MPIQNCVMHCVSKNFVKISHVVFSNPTPS